MRYGKMGGKKGGKKTAKVASIKTPFTKRIMGGR